MASHYSSSSTSSLADDSASYQQQHHHHQHPAALAPAAPSAQSGRKQASLAQIPVPSFSAFQKLLPSALHHPNAAAFHQKSPRAASFSRSEQASPRLVDPTSRPWSLDSPLPPQPIPREGEEDHLQREDSSSYTIPPPSHARNDSIDSRIASSIPSSNYSSPRRSSIPVHTNYAHRDTAPHAPQHSISSFGTTEQHLSPTQSLEHDHSSMTATHQQAPTMTLQFNGIQRTLSDESLDAESPSSAKRPKSPAGRLGSLFGWNGRPEDDSSPTTTFSERSLSPLPSPGLVKTLPVNAYGRRASARLTPPGLDIQKANETGAYFDNPQTPLLIGDDMSNVHVRELERELQHISQELAGSIRREMELEDELDRMRTELPMIPPSDLSHRRSSDYFSDSGTSSTKFPIVDPDAKIDQLDKQLRKVEQEKANLKMEMASRLQTELSRRRDLEELVQNLEDQLEKQGQQGLVEEKLEELETTLDETRRRLGQEKMTKENFEDLASATRQELEQHRNEADNLRNDVVPQLKARVEGLEAEAADNQALVYENTRLQQELTALKEKSAQVNHSRFNSIAEEGVISAVNPRMSLSRTGSVARSSSLRRGGSQKEGGRQRSGSNGLAYPDGVKEIEDQRDALHKALKLLLRRHERQHREHERAMKKITKDRESAEQITPKRTAYTKEVSFLKDEVSTLRKRTEDALEQKWQYEKNLSGLKMDLDRAEQETRGLRIILQENDINAPSESSVSGAEEDEQLKLSISRAENERDHARQRAEEYRQRARSGPDGSSEELMSSAKRMDELAEQLEKQAQANSQLRERLATAIAKGEREQKDSTRQIEEMQRRLAGMEDSVLAAQQHSETTLASHDAEVRRIEDASSPQLQRLRISIPDSSKLGPASPLLRKSPRLGSKKLSETSLLEISKTQMLERKVRELEGLLREAEEDVQTVVQRVNRSQMEVADLQTERDAALIQMRKLQTLIVEEGERAEAFMP